MTTSLVLTIIGADRPGLVEELSRLVREHEANWEQSRMARLAGRFAGILRVTVPANHAESLERALGALSERGLRVLVDRAEEPNESGLSRSLELQVVGTDRPGIVSQISEALAQRGVNVDELSTACEAAPMAGGMLFRASAKLRVPATVELSELRTRLEALAHDLMIDLDVLDADS